ncbi:TerC family protein [Flammeovirga sp. SubArs3]|uniref:TerC family protein n=1 Tax=Flammeovirga sp. SubArs3 TaxID=2995316 RepID=UPI00248B5936|nr:TerC family protein [Flammeovirga sp. SubArs3]
MESLFTTAGLISLVTLTLLEIVLGIDNVIFISIVSSKLPKEQQDKARNLGIILALFVRIALLFSISWLVGLEDPLFTIPFVEHLDVDGALSGRDLILLCGGLFLIAKTTSEIHNNVEGDPEEEMQVKRVKSLWSGVLQIVMIDIVFSFDSILTAVGLVKEIEIMITAVVISLGIMLFFSKKIAQFVDSNPTIKMLALSFLVMIGFLLVIEAFGVHVPKGYVYFAMAFAFIVELLNIRSRKKNPNRTKLAHQQHNITES